MRISSLHGIITESQIVLFFKKIHKTDSCWEWIGGTNQYGYGKFRIGSSKDRTRCTCPSHRISYMLFKGDIPDDLNICHSCDNPKCVNPDHLWTGTHNDNVQDKILKGRDLRGEKHQNSKLTSDQIKEIREEYSHGNISMSKLGKKYSVCSAVIHDIVHRKSWVHID